MGRHRRGWLSNLVTAVKRYYGFGVTVPHSVSVLPRCASDDWHADPPTVELPVLPLVSGVPHTSPSEYLRGRSEVESPIFAELARPLGYDPVRGFDALFSVDGLVAA